ncbi:MAG TPA: thioredoxin domain-containing protein [Coriobacteriia bacterium]
MANPRLANASSPYLRQHADDPVDWHLWGTEAFDLARERGVPIFLSVGFSACHWCHVMQRESFRDPDTAALLNSRFVPVKVDRELRPDVDALYMDYVVATTGHGGWPMSVFLSPELAPVLGGTYFPTKTTGSLPAFLDVLHAIDEAYGAGDEKMREVISGSLDFLRGQSAPKPACDLDASALDESAEYLVRLTDPSFGGFGKEAKFPEASLTLFLCAYYGVNPDAEIPFVVGRSLTSMLRGGVYDQAGGGLFRYAVDRAWRTPHFEKMLYDQALLLSSLAAALPLASEETVRDEYAHAARRTAAFLSSEMTAEGGGYIAALAADTGGIEGATYTWTREQLAAVLDGPAYDLAVSDLGADSEVEPFTLIRAHGRAGDADALDRVLETIKTARDLRLQPPLDTKVVTSWNALTARGLVEAGAAFAEPRMSADGLATLVALLERALTPEGLVHVADDESVAGVRLIEDYAHTVAACLTAHETTGDGIWLERAAKLHADTLESFCEGDLLYMTPATTELPVRPREQSDQPVPSGAATAIDNAVRLAVATGDEGYAEWARAALRNFWAVADAAPEHAGRAMEAAARLVRL